MTKATAARHSAPMSCTASASGRPTIRPASIAPGHAADAAEDRRGEQRQQQVEAHLRADLDQEAGHDAGHRGERRAEHPDDADRRLRTSMPATPASCGFSLTARIERPMPVRVSSRCTATTSDDRDAERQQLVGRRADAAAERHGDLQRLGVSRRASR